MNLSVLFSQIMCFLLFLFFPLFRCWRFALVPEPSLLSPSVSFRSLGEPSTDRDIPKFNRSSGAPPDEMRNVDKHERWLRNQFLATFKLAFLI